VPGSLAPTVERLPGSNGVHVYVLIKDSFDIERFLHTLLVRCWLHGFGWMLVGTSGQLLERSLIVVWFAPQNDWCSRTPHPGAAGCSRSSRPAAHRHRRTATRFARGVSRPGPSRAGQAARPPGGRELSFGTRSNKRPGQVYRAAGGAYRSTHELHIGHSPPFD
jgi:hypothetical protein